MIGSVVGPMGVHPVSPVPEYPAGHSVQEKLPVELIQSVRLSQIDESRHSLMSVQSVSPLPLYPDGQAEQ